ncbi:MAG: sulfatase-like hydrolase/transferase [bacterium]
MTACPLRALALALALALASCGGGGERGGSDESARGPAERAKSARAGGWRAHAPPGAAAGWNVLLITLDTTRRDRIGCYGYALAETPAIDALASRGVRFDDAVTSAPLTLPSHATMFTGLYPPRHGVRDNGRQSLAPAHETLAEVLRARGYATGAFVGAFVLDERFGLAQGFDTYDFAVSAAGYRPKMPDFNERGADAVTDAAIAWLEGQSGAPFFAWAHYFDPHLPYESPLEREARFAGRGYDAEIAFVDAQIARLVDAIERQGRLEKTLIVVTADHGEALGEHGEPTHGLFVYEATMRAPLIVSAKALFDRAYVEVDRIAGLVDLRATIEDLLGIAPAVSSAPAATNVLEDSSAPVTAATDGVSLLRTDVDPNRAIYIETLSPFYLAGWSPLQGLRTRSAKYILAPAPEYYDLRADPGEASNAYATGGAALAAMRDDLAARIDAWSTAEAIAGGAGGIRDGAAPDANARTLSDEEIERLESLGYLQGASSAPPRAAASEGAAAAAELADPKAMIATYTAAHDAEHAYEAGRFDEAARLAREVVAACPSCVSALRVLAFSLMRLERADEAVELLQDSAHRIHDTFLYRSLAQLLILRGRCADAAPVLEAYEALDPTDGRVAMLRGDCLANEKRWAEAIAQFERAASLDPNRTGQLARERIERTRAAASAAGAPSR